MAVDIHRVSHWTTQQLVNRHAQHLTANVPKRDVDARNHTRRRTSRTHVREVPENLVPDLLDVLRIIALQQIRHMPDQRCDPAIGLVPSTGNLAPSRHALVGIHLYK